MPQKSIPAIRPRYYEMDGRGELTPVAPSKLPRGIRLFPLEESGWDVFRLMKAGFGWMLLRGGLRMEVTPLQVGFHRGDLAFCQPVVLRTREYRTGTRKGPSRFRPFALAVLQPGAQEARARLRRNLEVLVPEGTEAGPWRWTRSRRLLRTRKEPAPRFEVRRSEIDTNGHANK
jgi:hypothetical protein